MIRVALRGLRAHKLRSGLTSLGIVIGIAAVIALVSAGSGARLLLEDRLESVGTRLIVVRAGARTGSGMVTDFTPLTMADVEAVRREVGPLLVGVSASQIAQRVASTSFSSWETSIAGTLPEVFPVRNWEVEQGRPYTNDDLRAAAPVCLLGQTVRRRLFPDGRSPVGEWIRVGRLRVKVIGLLGAKGRSPTGADQDDQVFMPLTTLQRRLTGEERIVMILASARSQELIEPARERIVQVLRRRHNIRPGQADDFDVSTVQEMAGLARTVTGALQILVAAVASISLVVGGVGVMNIMLVSVTERTREIGLRMAVGARPRDVLMQFLLEAVALTVFGGTVGVVLGLLAAAGVAGLVGWPLVVSPAAVVTAFAVSAGVGVFFGLYPAWKASRLDPVEALRHE